MKKQKRTRTVAAAVFLLAVLFIGILGQYAYRSSERAVEQAYQVSYGNALKNTSRVLDMNLRTVVEAVRGFLNEPSLKAVLEAANYNLPAGFSTEDRRQLDEVGKTLAQQNAYVNSILFMDLQGNHYILNNVNRGTYEFDQYYRQHSLLEEPWIQKSREAKGKELFWGESIFGADLDMGNVFYLTKYLNNPSTGRPMGYLVVVLSKSMIGKSIVTTTGSYSSSWSFVTEGSIENIVFGQGTEEEKDRFLSSVKKGTSEETYLFSEVQNETSGWTIRNVVKRQELGRESREIRMNVWLVGGVALALVILFMYMYWTNQRLAEHLMATQLNERESELQLLQSQINPHFLYNTLDSLYFMAIVHGDDQIADMTMSLSEHFKLTLNHGNKYMTIENSLQWIRGYLKILNLRFHDRFTLVENVDPELLHCEILTFLLQPFVENAMYHGLEPKIGEGTISITVQRAEKEGDMEIQILDDGVGMDDVSVWTSGFGVRNVEERIQLHYGAAYGIQVKSRRMEGTCVTITLPIE